MKDFEEGLKKVYMAFVPDMREHGSDGAIDQTTLLVNGVDIEDLPGESADVYGMMALAEDTAREAANNLRTELDREDARIANEKRLARERKEKESLNATERAEYARLRRKFEGK